MLKSRLASDPNASEKADRKLQEGLQLRRGQCWQRWLVPCVQCHAGALCAMEEASAKLLRFEAAPPPAGPLLLPIAWSLPVRGCLTVQIILTAHVPGREEFAATEHRLGFDFGLAVVDSLAAFPEHVEQSAIGQASHRQEPYLFHQIDL